MISSLVKLLFDKVMREKSNNPEDIFRSSKMLSDESLREKSNDHEGASHSSKMLVHKAPRAKSNDHEDASHSSKMLGDKAPRVKSNDHEEVSHSSKMLVDKAQREKSNDHEVISCSLKMHADKTLKANSNDPGWKYAIWPDLKNKRKLQCTLCGMVTNRGITGQKEHLVGGFRTVDKCQLTTPEIVDEMQSWMTMKKEKRNLNIPKGTCYDDDSLSSTDDITIDTELFKRKKGHKSAEGYRVSMVDDNFTEGEKGKVDDMCASFIYKNDLPISIVKNPSFVALLEAAQQHDGVYIPPSVDELRTIIHKRRGRWKEEARKKKNTRLND